MNVEKKYWRWTTTVIDFAKLPQEKIYGSRYRTKEDEIFRYLPLPTSTTEIHEWYNGGWSCEYNCALHYAIEYGLAEWVEDE